MLSRKLKFQRVHYNSVKMKVSGSGGSCLEDVRVRPGLLENKVSGSRNFHFQQTYCTRTKIERL